MRRRLKRRCDECGTWITPRQTTHRFCSDACRNKHWRERHPRTAIVVGPEDVLRAIGKEES